RPLGERALLGAPARGPTPAFVADLPVLWRVAPALLLPLAGAQPLPPVPLSPCLVAGPRWLLGLALRLRRRHAGAPLPSLADGAVQSEVRRYSSRASLGQIRPCTLRSTASPVPRTPVSDRGGT